MKTLSHLKALADPTRLRLLTVLEDHELTVGELTTVLGLAQSRVSGHLAVLREADLVRDRKQGTSSHYSLAPEGEAAATWRAVRETLEAIPHGDEDRRRLATVLHDRRERSREFFDRVSEAWDQRRSESLGSLAGTACLAGLLPRERTILDLGTGTGGLLPLLARSVNGVIAIDSSPGMLRMAQARAAELGLDNVSFLHGDLEHLPVPDRTVDGVVANMVLHHVQDPRTALAEMARVLRPDGRGVVVDFAAHEETWLLEEEGHRWAGFDPAQLGAWCVDAGLTVPDFARVPTPDSGRWARLEMFTARFGKHRTRP